MIINLYYDLPLNCIELVDFHVHKFKMQKCLFRIEKSIRRMRVYENENQSFSWYECDVIYKMYDPGIELDITHFFFGEEVLVSIYKLCEFGTYGSKVHKFSKHNMNYCSLIDTCFTIEQHCKQNAITGYSKITSSNKIKYLRLLYGRNMDEPIGSK